MGRSDYPAYPQDIDPALQLFLESLRQTAIATDVTFEDHDHTASDITTGEMSRDRLPNAVAYEDEANTFDTLQTMEAGIATDTVAEEAAGVGVTVDGLTIKDSKILELEARARFSRR